MRENALKAKLLRDEVCVGPMLMTADPHIVGVLAGAGFDYVMSDLEHTSISLRDLEAVVRAADAAGTTPTTRVAGSSKADILAVLETGVRSIMVPAVESAEEARRIVAVSRYAPEGERGVYYMGYNSEYSGIDPARHFAESNRELLIIVQVETAAGVQHAAEIAAVPGVDCILVGPGDLTQSLGLSWQFHHERVWEAIRHTFDVTRKAGKIAGIMPAGIDHARHCVDHGARLLIWGPDTVMLQRAAREDALLLTERLAWHKNPSAR